MREIVPQANMATTTAREPPTTCTVVEPVDADGTCTLHQRTRGTSYHVVDYADELLRKKLASSDVGDAVRVDLAPADPDGLDWIVTRVHPGAATTPVSPW